LKRDLLLLNESLLAATTQHQSSSRNEAQLKDRLQRVESDLQAAQNELHA